MKYFIMVLVLVFATGCTRVETGEVGLRMQFDKTINPTELIAGSLNQTMVGDVLTFTVRDVSIALDNKNPQTLDNSVLADFDVTAIYNVVPATVADLYTTKSRAFHHYEGGDIYLMYNYLETTLNNASYKAVRKYDALKVADNRDKIEADIMVIMIDELKKEKLDTMVNVTKIMVRNVQPDPKIVASATAVITEQNLMLATQMAVKTALQEAERQKLLSTPASLAYMKAQSELNISEGVREGKVQTVLIPHGMVMYGNGK